MLAIATLMDERHQSLAELGAYVTKEFRQKELEPQDAEQWTRDVMEGWRRTGWTMEMVNLQ